jgi:hypothetical protein
VDLSSVAPYAALAVALVIFLSIDLRFFARGREPSFREGVWWSLGWLVVSLAAALIVWWFDDGEAAVLYTTVYLIERSLSLDNLFVFILLFAYFAVPSELRARLLFWGIVFALILRGIAIAGGIALIEEFHFVIYLLGILLIALAVRVWRGVEENVDPDRNLMVRLVRRVFPVSNSYHGHHWFIHEGGIRYATPLLLCLAADPRRIRHHAGPAADLDGQRLRPARPAGAVRAGGGADAAVPLPRRDDRGRTRPRRRKALDRGRRGGQPGGEPRRRRARVHDRDRAQRVGRSPPRRGRRRVRARRTG